MRSLGRNLPIRFAEWIWYKWNKRWLIAATLWKCDFSRCFHALCKDSTGWHHCQEAVHRSATGETAGSIGYILANVTNVILNYAKLTRLTRTIVLGRKWSRLLSEAEIGRFNWKSEFTGILLRYLPESSLYTLLYGHGTQGAYMDWRSGEKKKSYRNIQLQSWLEWFVICLPKLTFSGRERKLSKGLSCLSNIC